MPGATNRVSELDMHMDRYAGMRIYGYADISILILMEVLLDLDQNGRTRRDIGKRRVDGP